MFSYLIGLYCINNNNIDIKFNIYNQLNIMLSAINNNIGI